MPSPSSNELTAAYYRVQIDRIVATLNKIASRSVGPSVGYAIPAADDITIHDGRRIEATVMFLDICKFSSRPCESAEEQATMLQIISLFFTEMIRIIEDHDGVVEKNTGDGLMAYFALNMFSAADLINPVLQRSAIPPLDFRICMDHGLVTVAKVGVARRFNGIVAIGTTANIASKMLAIAKENTILLGDQMLPGLPSAWVQQMVELESLETGWSYRQPQKPYPFWRYKGRWMVTNT